MDRASNLPDDVLCHIMSFLTTKEAASTSALSKRWHDLWTFIPNLDIDDSVFLHPEEGKGEREGIRQSFVDFVDRVVASQGDSPIKKFSLKCITGVHPDCVNRWIGNVLQRGVLNLGLFIDFTSEDIQGGYNLPKEMFVSKTLVELKIRSERRVDWLSGANCTFLPMLKTLDLDSENVCLNNKIESFLLSFPVLEELRIAVTDWEDSEEEKVSSASLRKLSIHTTFSSDPVNPKSISFDTPNLVYFNYSDHVAEDYPLVNMKALVDAQINLMLTDGQTERVRMPIDVLLEEDEFDEVLQFGNVVKLMNGIQNVQLLCFSADTLEVLSLCCDTMPVFNNVISLVINSEEDRGWQALPVLLRKCPNLEALIFEGLLHFETDKCGDACSCISREEKGRSLASCPAKRLEVRGFKGKAREMHIIKHFLESFTCLKDMWIFADENGPVEFKVLARSEPIKEMIYIFNELSSCHVQFLKLYRN